MKMYPPTVLRLLHLVALCSHAGENERRHAIGNGCCNRASHNSVLEIGVLQAVSQADCKVARTIPSILGLGLERKKSRK